MRHGAAVGITSKVVVRVPFGFTLDRAKPIAYRATNAQRPSARESRDSQVVKRIQFYGFSFLRRTEEEIIFNTSSIFVNDSRYEQFLPSLSFNDLRTISFIYDLDTADYAVPKKIQPGRSLSRGERSETDAGGRKRKIGESFLQS